MLHRSRIVGVPTMLYPGPRRTRLPGPNWPQNLIEVFQPLTPPTVPDESPGGNDGTMVNMDATDVIAGTPGGDYSQWVMEFNGSDEYVDFGDVLDCNLTVSFTWSIWFQSSGTLRYIFSKRDISTGRGYSLALDSSGRVEMYFAGGVSSTTRKRTDAAFNDGAWHHCCVTKAQNGAGAPASDFNIYMDGTVVANTVITSDAFATVTNNNISLNVGTAEDGVGGLYFPGLVDSFAIYEGVGSETDSELTADEVSTIYNGGRPNKLTALPSASKLDGWWRMGENRA